MIVDLTKAYLAHFGISEIQLNITNNKLFRSDIKNAKVIYISRTEGKIYTDANYYESKHYYNYRENDFNNKKELSFPTDCPASIPDYYDSMLFIFLHQKNVDYDFYDIKFKTKMFINDEIKKHELVLKCHKSRVITLPANKLLEFEQYIETHKMYLDYLENRFKQLEKEPTEKSPIINPQKTIFDFINNVKDKEMFMQDLKKEFPTAEGLEMKAIIESLKISNVLVAPYGKFKPFYDLLFKYFDEKIGSRQGVIAAELDDRHNELIKSIEDKLKPLINKYKNQ